MTDVDTGLRVRPLLTEDEPTVVELLATALGQGPTGNLTEEFFAWKHRANPFGPSPGLLAEHEGQIVGVRLFLRWQLEALGQPILALRAVDTATDPGHQGRGIFRRLTLDLLSRLQEAGEVDLVFNTPNGSSRPGYLKMGWQSVGTLPVRLHPVRSVRVLRGAHAAGGTIATAARGAGPEQHAPHDLPACPFHTAGLVLHERGQEVETLLAESAQARELHTPRSLAYLTWRYGDAPGLDYRCITVESGGQLSGIAFGRLRRRGPLNEFTLSDLVVRDGDQHAARRLLWAARRSGGDHVAVHTPSGTTEDRTASTTGYFRVPRQGLGLVANPRRATPVDPLEVQSWKLSLGDLEVF